MNEDDGVFGAGNDGWRKEDEGGKNGVMSVPFGANGRIKKCL
jgi:hypothetical protein